MKMKFLDKLERKFGRYAIQNISLMLIICYAFGYAIQFVNADFLNYLTLNPYLILRGQIWRLITWILIPPSDFGIFTILTLYFYYWIGTTLERTWGTFRYNVYLLSGMLFTILGAFVLLAYSYAVFAPQIAMIGSRAFFTDGIGYFFRAFSTYYVNLSIFLAFALTFPDMQVLLFFIIPIRIKWLGILDAIMTVYTFFASGIAYKIIIGASLLNVVVFFLATRDRVRMSPKQIRRRQVYRQEVKKGTGITRHKCAICGRTEKDGDLEFRFCSKCDGNYEYCQDHLFTHEHVKHH
jgi:hypothetical protein